MKGASRFIVALAISVGVGVIVGQSSTSSAFEGASIKPSKEGLGSSGWDSHPGSIVLRGPTLKGLIVIAYGVKPEQVSGGPKWLDAHRFDINARANVSVGTLNCWRCCKDF